MGDKLLGIRVTFKNRIRVTFQNRTPYLGTCYLELEVPVINRTALSILPFWDARYLDLELPGINRSAPLPFGETNYLELELRFRPALSSRARDKLLGVRVTLAPTRECGSKRVEGAFHFFPRLST